MSDPDKKHPDDEIREEYDFSQGIRGKYAKRFRERSNVVVLDADVAAQFESAQAVNEALREHLRRKRAGGER